MPDREIEADIHEIRFKMESIETTQFALVRANERALRGQYEELFKGDAALRAVYLAIDGKDTQKEIVARLKAAGTRSSDATVSRKIEILRDYGLVDLAESSKAGNVYRKSHLMEQVFQVSRMVERLGRA